MQSDKSYHILIYGAEVDDDQDIKVIYPFKEYRTIMSSKETGIKFIGIQFDKIDGLFENYTHHPNLLILSKSEPAQYIKNLWEELYPSIEGKCYALLRNVQHSHYANGHVAYGYWVNSKDDNVCDSLSDNHGNIINGLTLSSIEHDQCSNVPTPYFYGEILGILSDNEDHDDCENLADAIMRIYHPCVIPTREKCISNLSKFLNLDDSKLLIFSDEPEIAVICNYL